MYSARGIGRQSYGGRQEERSRHTPDQYSSSYGPASPDPTSQMSDRDYRDIDRKPKIYDERQDMMYKNSPNNDNSCDSKGGHTPPGAPPNKERVNPDPPYVPNTSASKPMQPNYSPNDTPNHNSPYPSTPAHNFDSSRPSNPLNSRPFPPTGAPSQPYRNSANDTYSGPSGGPQNRDQYGDQETEKEREEREWETKCAHIFVECNSLDDLLDLKEKYANKQQSLDNILQKSHLREGEILRNKRRDRDGFKDPMMLELRRMQEDIKKKLEEVNKFRVEVDKRIRQYNKLLKESQPDFAVESSCGDKPSNYEAQLLQNSVISSTADGEEEEEDEYEHENSTREYYDPGSHWCRDCDKMVTNLDEFFEHLHSKEHWKTGNTDVKPWKRTKRQTYPPKPGQVKTKTPIKGVQFLIPLRGFFCPLCKEYLADTLMAEEHMKGGKHFRFYQRFIAQHGEYEQKWHSDKGKAFNRHQANERKRIKEEEQKEAERKKKLEEQKLKQEKESKKKKKEEDLKRKMKEEREREREREEWKKSNRTNSNSTDRFRLKGVTMNLKDEKPIITFNKDYERSRDRDRDRDKDGDKHKKRTRIYSSDSDSSDSRSPPRKKKPTWFGDPYKDPKLKKNTSVKLIRLSRKTVKQYNCKYQLAKLIEEAKQRQHKVELESKTEISLANDDDDDQDEKENKDALKSVVDGILANLDDDNDNKDDIRDKHQTNETKDNHSNERMDENSGDTKDKPRDDNKSENKSNDESFGSERDLQIDMNAQKDSSSKKETIEEERCDSKASDDSKNSETKSDDKD